ncbi:Lipase, GDSL [Corchorus olitorius]|uniref:Lipase, GDSL n=1 Tax=Corchorus olitorius TaxID=93759 RepID=A0A1R3HBS9_9ROSI|nr:Lipase, GDSL [Corchorus olitorius]
MADKQLKPFWVQLSISTLMLLLITKWGNAKPQVPCYFVFGDSFSDNGNNNKLNTLAKVNYRPYGIDFPKGPTGRFSNGRNMQDFIVKYLGFEDYIPPFAKAKGKRILKGVNYASGSAGIRDESGEKLGHRVSLNQQLRNHKTIISRINSKLGDSSAKKLLSQCIYSLQIGCNDYFNNYFQPEFYNTSSQYTPKQYAMVLIDQYSEQIKSLYDTGARKFALYGVGLIGCIPSVIKVYGTNNESLCVDRLNIAASIFDERLKLLVQQLNANLTEAKFTFINPTPNTLEIVLSGFTMLRQPCCKIGGGGGELCVRNSKPCRFRSRYVFWDGVHTTEAWNRLTARIAFRTHSPTNAFPFNIRKLAKQ